MVGVCLQATAHSEPLINTFVMFRRSLNAEIKARMECTLKCSFSLLWSVCSLAVFHGYPSKAEGAGRTDKLLEAGKHSYQSNETLLHK